ncbi:uncharacterized protein LOC131629904 [Vicia villosa]|uniref:uncharacterized protein LOC131607591 n=1 Tax=Vicia villosa TaxID=3911 RepID=UPI00273BD96E|nr:uncharacterized protein LOC131607591 [Vicia villosa]XP_058740354.1 uncharacterized protein LOC131612605 [Vicia villosa]XP_058749068.1 uncharacterized protein LOC131622034 [Vicia villosa]XP_058756690.1 uncharacterized protein LOC131629904 [Vicia villosa]
MGSFSQVAKACRTMKFFVVQDPVKRLAIKRRMKQRSKMLRMSLKTKKERITKLCTEWALHVMDGVACAWQRGSKIQNIAGVWQDEMLGIRWSGKHQELRGGLRFAVLEDVDFLTDVLGSVGLEINPRMIEISNSVYIGNFFFENEREWMIWTELVEKLKRMG